MGQITLIRHGQANSYAKSEDEYDRLSDLGHDQTRRLKTWFDTQNITFDCTYVGSLKRQQQTASNIGLTPDVIDERLNEIAYYHLSDAMATFDSSIQRNGPTDFVTHFPATMTAWKNQDITGAETYEDFTKRISDLCDELKAKDLNIVCVSSGGVIAQVITHVMGLDLMQMTKVALPIWNSSIHQITFTEHGPFLSLFNSVPHLDSADCQDMKTVY